MSQVTIGPSYFKKEFKEYSNWQFAYIREALQNCIDAPGSKRIIIGINENQAENTTTITFRNDGRPMCKDTIEQKLLSLGESGKNFENGSVGGFGKAKILLYFAHKQYTIETGKYVVNGVGGSYTINEQEPKAGTISTVVIEGKQANNLQSALQRFARYTQWPGELYILKDGQNQKLATNLHKGTFKRELPFGRVYANPYVTGIVCRMHGIPMFIDQYSTDKGIIIELNGNSGDCLTSNRDMLQYTYRNQLSEFIKLLGTNASKALRAESPSVRHFPGIKLAPSFFAKKPKLEKTNPVQHEEEPEEAEEVPVEELAHATATLLELKERRKVQEVFERQPDARAVSNLETIHRGYDFFLRNETRLQIPNHYLPSQFSEYSDKLLKSWVNVLRLTYSVLDAPYVQFSVGFVFSEDSEAMYCRERGDTIYYINPCKIVTDKTSTRFKKRFLLTERDRIISIATHEVVHGFGLEYHDENFAAKLTDAMALVMKNRSKFNSCFKF